MTRPVRWAVYGLAGMWGGIMLCIGGVSKPAAVFFIGVGLIVASYGMLSEKEPPKTPAHHVRERPSGRATFSGREGRLRR